MTGPSSAAGEGVVALKNPLAWPWGFSVCSVRAHLLQTQNPGRAHNATEEFGLMKMVQHEHDMRLTGPRPIAKRYFFASGWHVRARATISKR
jgi:hypothetical protein